MNNTPSEILQYVLTQESSALFTMPNANGLWPLYITAMPDSGKDDVACLYDTQGEILGRLLASGKHLVTFGVQLKTRGFDPKTAYALADNAAKQLEVVNRMPVVLGSDSYRIDTIRQTSPVLSMGQDEKRRALCTVNFLLMLLDV